MNILGCAEDAAAWDVEWVAVMENHNQVGRTLYRNRKVRVQKRRLLQILWRMNNVKSFGICRSWRMKAGSKWRRWMGSEPNSAHHCYTWRARLHQFLIKKSFIPTGSPIWPWWYEIQLQARAHSDAVLLNTVNCCCSVYLNRCEAHGGNRSREMSLL